VCSSDLGDGGESLGTLARRWAAETFGVSDAEAYIAPAERPETTADIAVSLGVGENAAKRIEDPFEPRLLSALARLGSVVIDAGAGGEEAERVRRALGPTQGRPGGPAAGRGPAPQIYQGSFAGFASIVSRARLYVGYDSAGQHVAAACGVPLVSVFAGYPCERFCARWRPTGKGTMSVLSRVPGESAEAVLARLLRLL
jgi:ADP-heptose:LPS heptosyltransferase